MKLVVLVVLCFQQVLSAPNPPADDLAVMKADFDACLQETGSTYELVSVSVRKMGKRVHKDRAYFETFVLGVIEETLAWADVSNKMCNAEGKEGEYIMSLHARDSLIGLRHLT
ncbi:hypothetical protein FOCC_FOCC011902 [Frankliniella occidentalis]|nr:hypothetical protein FOCC_FOCC011902 [Frankliniella occidentalis]